MKHNYINFEIKLANGSKAKVAYCKGWSNHKEIDNSRTDHFEFTDNLYISETSYRSHFIMMDYDNTYDPIQASTELGNAFANLDNTKPTQIALI